MSEEDINCIEDTIGDFKINHKDEKCLFIESELINILERLYNEYKNLKQIEQEHQKQNGELRKEIYKLKDELEDTIFRKDETIADIETDYNVLKFKIEEKIKEVEILFNEENGKKTVNSYLYQYGIDVLKELLESE